MRNEGVFIIEWLAHHRVIGFDHIVVCSNHCRDGSDALLDGLAAVGLCHHEPVEVSEGVYPQSAVYQTIAEKRLISNDDWTMVLDADEFLNIHTGDHSLAALVEALPENADSMAISMKNFGSSGLKEWADEPVTERFTRTVAPDSKVNMPVKSLVRNPGHYARLGNHHPQDFLLDRAPHVVNAGLDRIPIDASDNRQLWKHVNRLEIPQISHQLAQINHYSIKTFDSYRLRRRRGRGWGDTVRHTRHYFVLHDEETATDVTIDRYREARRAEEERIRSLPGIREAEERVLRWYRRKLRRLVPKEMPS